MRILVTGGAGFIGSHVADAFVADAHEVAVLDSLVRGSRTNVPAKASFTLADITDGLAVGRFVDEFRPEVLVHHAAQVSVRGSVSDPAGDAATNVVGSLTVLEACVRAGTRRVLFASAGGAVYGEQARFPADESHPVAPVSPYGVAKLAVESYLRIYGDTYGVGWAALRYGNVYGPRQVPTGDSGIVAILSRAFATGRNVTLSGDGRQTRDYIHVHDVVEAVRCILDQGLCGIYNVSTGIETSLLSIHAKLAAIAGINEAPVFGPAQPGEQRRACLDAGRLMRESGWSPAIALDEGLATTYSTYVPQASHA